MLCIAITRFTFDLQIVTPTFTIWLDRLIAHISPHSLIPVTSCYLVVVIYPITPFTIGYGCCYGRWLLFTFPGCPTIPLRGTFTFAHVDGYDSLCTVTHPFGYVIYLR